MRTERGIGVIYVDRHDTSPLAVIEAVNALRRNEIICLIGDRDGSSNTVQLDFFGQPTDIRLVRPIWPWPPEPRSCRCLSRFCRMAAMQR